MHQHPKNSLLSQVSILFKFNFDAFLEGTKKADKKISEAASSENQEVR